MKCTFSAKDWTTEEKWTQVLSDIFYEAQITCDVILGWPFLQGHALGVMPHKSSLMWEHKDGWAWLTGCHDRAPMNINRVWITDDYAVRTDLVQEVIDKFGVGTPTIDTFASDMNTRFPRKWTKTIDAFAQDWSKERLLWINPPFNKIDRVIKKIKEEKAKAIMIVPRWEHQKWWSDLQDIAMDSFVLDHPGGIYIKDSERLVSRPKWATLAFLVDGALPDLDTSAEATSRHLRKYWDSRKPWTLSQQPSRRSENSARSEV